MASSVKDEPREADAHLVESFDGAMAEKRIQTREAMDQYVHRFLAVHLGKHLGNISPHLQGFLRIVQSVAEGSHDPVTVLDQSLSHIVAEPGVSELRHELRQGLAALQFSAAANRIARNLERVVLQQRSSNRTTGVNRAPPDPAHRQRPCVPPHAADPPDEVHAR